MAGWQQLSAPVDAATTDEFTIDWQRLDDVIGFPLKVPCWSRCWAFSWQWRRCQFFG